MEEIKRGSMREAKTMHWKCNGFIIKVGKVEKWIKVLNNWKQERMKTWSMKCVENDMTRRELEPTVAGKLIFLVIIVVGRNIEVGVEIKSVKNLMMAGYSNNGHEGCKHSHV